MIKLSPNLMWLFADRPFAQRIEAAAEASDDPLGWIPSGWIGVGYGAVTSTRNP